MQKLLVVGSRLRALESGRFSESESLVYKTGWEARAPGSHLPYKQTSAPLRTVQASKLQTASRELRAMSCKP